MFSSCGAGNKWQLDSKSQKDHFAPGQGTKTNNWGKYTKRNKPTQNQSVFPVCYTVVESKRDRP